MNFQDIYQRQSFSKAFKLDYETRRLKLKNFLDIIEKHTDKISAALKSDLGKSPTQSYISEIGFVLEEGRYILKNLKKWMRPQKVSTPLVHFPAKSAIYSEAYGQVLIMAPWNYPFQLLLSPFIGAWAAGNRCFLRPSELAPQTSQIISELVSECFLPEEAFVVLGDLSVSQALLDFTYDYIFFTGSTRVGQIIMEKASRHLTPLTLELGGKSPCIVDKNCDLSLTAKRIVWGKFFNAGQTCVAPDYLLVEESVLESLSTEMKKYLSQFYGPSPHQSSDYERIINQNHFERLESYLEEISPSDWIVPPQSLEKTQLYFPPCIFKAHLDQKAMKEEIFGPLLPVMTYKDIKEAKKIITSLGKPLAFYLFSREKNFVDDFLDNFSCGGVCVNDTLVHLASNSLPFGGVGPSGMGHYHGKYSFNTFSHQKSVMKRSFWADLPLRYPPYKGKLGPLKWLLRFFS